MALHLVTRVRRYAAAHDHAAPSREEDPQWLYSVRFDGPELWSEAADPTLKVSVDAWEPYLERA